MSAVAAPTGRHQCPGCAGSLDAATDALRCRRCGASYPVRNGIPLFGARPRYWGNVDAEAMQTMTRHAETEGWRAAIRGHLPEIVWGHVEEPARADGVFFLPMEGELAVLDAGCMWGGLTVPLARRFARVAAIDATFESVDFLRVRAAQEKLDNLEVACGDLRALPYPDGGFDIVFVNGVLEWVGLTDDFVIERDYGRRTRGRQWERVNPRAAQRQALREACRVLRPGGRLYLAIENRWAYKYFMGAVDDHSAMRFTSFMPRRLADAYMRLRLGQPYRTYTYSARALARLLGEAGFEVEQAYACCDTYRDPQSIIPLDERGMIDFYFRTFRLGNVPRWKRLVFTAILAAGLGPWLVPSFIVIARRPAERTA